MRALCSNTAVINLKRWDLSASSAAARGVARQRFRLSGSSARTECEKSSRPPPRGASCHWRKMAARSSSPEPRAHWDKSAPTAAAHVWTLASRGKRQLADARTLTMSRWVPTKKEKYGVGAYQSCSIVSFALAPCTSLGGLAGDGTGCFVCSHSPHSFGSFPKVCQRKPPGGGLSGYFAPNSNGLVCLLCCREAQGWECACGSGIVRGAPRSAPFPVRGPRLQSNRSLTGD